MWTPHLEQYQDDAGRTQRIGWVLGSTQPARGARGGFMHSGMRDLNKATDALAQLRKADLAIYENREMTRKEKRERLETRLSDYATTVLTVADPVTGQEVTLSAAGWVTWAKAFYDHAHNAVNAPPEPEPEE